MRLSLLPLSLAALLVPAVAKADTFTVTGSGGGFSGSATFTATKNTSTDPTLAGSYVITGINYPGATLLGVNNDGIFNSNDNLLFPTNSRLLDPNGFSFVENYQGQLFTLNIFADGTLTNGAFNYYALGFDPNGDYIDSQINFAVTAAPTPEPSSLLLLGTGLTGAAGALLRKKRAMQAA